MTKKEKVIFDNWMAEPDEMGVKSL